MRCQKLSAFFEVNLRSINRDEKRPNEEWLKSGNKIQNLQYTAIHPVLKEMANISHLFPIVFYTYVLFASYTSFYIYTCFALSYNDYKNCIIHYSNIDQSFKINLSFLDNAQLYTLKINPLSILHKPTLYIKVLIALPGFIWR